MQARHLNEDVLDHRLRHAVIDHHQESDGFQRVPQSARQFVPHAGRTVQVGRQVKHREDVSRRGLQE
jgi:hypothetical protein